MIDSSDEALMYLQSDQHSSTICEKCWEGLNGDPYWLANALKATENFPWPDYIFTTTWNALETSSQAGCYWCYMIQQLVWTVRENGELKVEDDTPFPVKVTAGVRLGVTGQVKPERAQQLFICLGDEKKLRPPGHVTWRKTLVELYIYTDYCTWISNTEGKIWN